MIALPTSPAPGGERLTQRLEELLRVANKALKLVSPAQQKALETAVHEIGAHRLLDTLGVTGIADPVELKALLEHEPNPMDTAATEEGQAFIRRWGQEHRGEIKRWRRLADTLTSAFLSSETGMGLDPEEADSGEAWLKRVGDALGNLKDVSALNRSALARTKAVERLAEERYRGHVVPRGFALREILLRSVEEVVGELSTEPGLARVCQYLKLAAKGLSGRQIGKELGLSREHVSRTYRKRALDLLGRRLKAQLKGYS
jgi:hypothetical protein